MIPILFRPFTQNGNFPSWFVENQYFLSWRLAFANSSESTDIVDKEEFIENAARLHALLLYYPERLAIVDHLNVAHFYLSGTEVEESSICQYVGLFVTSDQKPNRAGSLYARYQICESASVDQYMHSKTFALHAGRAVIVCGIEVAEHGWTDVVDEMGKLRRAGADRAFIKVCQNKYGVYEVDLSEDMSSALWDSLGFAAEHLAEKPGQLLLQEYVNMQYEYRIVVLNGKPVCGAGCIEDMTPLNNEQVFDCKVTLQRQHLQPGESTRAECIERRPDLIAAYQVLAEHFCMELTDEHPDWLNYSLDVCMINGKASVIELNSFQNIGLYAMDVGAMIQALVAV